MGCCIVIYCWLLLWFNFFSSFELDFLSWAIRHKQYWLSLNHLSCIYFNLHRLDEELSRFLWHSIRLPRPPCFQSLILVAGPLIWKMIRWMTKNAIMFLQNGRRWRLLNYVGKPSSISYFSTILTREVYTFSGNVSYTVK